MTAFATIISKQAVVVCPFFENIRHMCALLNWFFAGRRCVFLGTLNYRVGERKSSLNYRVGTRSRK